MTTQARTQREAVQELGDSIVGRLGIIGFPILQELRAALALPDDGGWISVEERLPEHHHDVLMVDSENNMFIGFHGNDDRLYMSYGDILIGKAAGHYYWRPLPAPPQAGTTQEGGE